MIKNKDIVEEDYQVIPYISTYNINVNKFNILILKNVQEVKLASISLEQLKLQMVKIKYFFNCLQ